MKSILIMLLTIMQYTYSQECTYNIPNDRIYFQGHLLEISQVVDPYMQSFGYKKLLGTSAKYLIDINFTSLSARPFELIVLSFMVYDEKTNIIFQREKTQRCTAQFCNADVAYQALNSVVWDLERRFPRCSSDN